MNIIEGKREAAPIHSINRRGTGERVGWLYMWNDGSTAPLWLTGPVEDVVYECLPPTMR